MPDQKAGRLPKAKALPHVGPGPPEDEDEEDEDEEDEEDEELLEDEEDDEELAEEELDEEELLELLLLLLLLEDPGKARNARRYGARLLGACDRSTQRTIPKASDTSMSRM